MATQLRLYCRLEYNGELRDPKEMPYVEILDIDKKSVLDTIVAEKEETGIYYADYNIPDKIASGIYYDKWIFKWEEEKDKREMITSFVVN